LGEKLFGHGNQGSAVDLRAALGLGSLSLGGYRLAYGGDSAPENLLGNGTALGRQRFENRLTMLVLRTQTFERRSGRARGLGRSLITAPTFTTALTVGAFTVPAATLTIAVTLRPAPALGTITAALAALGTA